MAVIVGVAVAFVNYTTNHVIDEMYLLINVYGNNYQKYYHKLDVKLQ